MPSPDSQFCMERVPSIPDANLFVVCDNQSGADKTTGTVRELLPKSLVLRPAPPRPVASSPLVSTSPKRGRSPDEVAERVRSAKRSISPAKGSRRASGNCDESQRRSSIGEQSLLESLYAQLATLDFARRGGVQSSLAGHGLGRASSLRNMHMSSVVLEQVAALHVFEGAKKAANSRIINKLESMAFGAVAEHISPDINHLKCPRLDIALVWVDALTKDGSPAKPMDTYYSALCESHYEAVIVIEFYSGRENEDWPVWVSFLAKDELSQVGVVVSDIVTRQEVGAQSREALGIWLRDLAPDRYLGERGISGENMSKTLRLPLTFVYGQVQEIRKVLARISSVKIGIAGEFFETDRFLL
ncbi:hypothetical protein JHW43_005643 [Diplocarpon mali]|nr:hypothetical protein JHW43_005643 [Diplocarpon mali]